MKFKSTILVLLVSVTTAFAQYESGVRFGIGQSGLHGGASGSQDIFAGQLGWTNEYRFLPFFGVGADFLFTSKGAKFRRTESTFAGGNQPYSEVFNVIGADVPLTAKLHLFGGSFSLDAFAGPSLNFNFGGWRSVRFDNSNYAENNDVSYDGINNLNTFNLGGTFGIGASVKKNSVRYGMDIRYTTDGGPMLYYENEGMSSNYWMLTFYSTF